MQRIFILFCLIFFVQIAFAQQNDSTKVLLFEVKMKDGSVLYGKIISQDAQEMELDTQNMGRVKLATAQIANIRQVENVTQGKYFRSSNRTRYLFAPSAFNLEKGELYYQNTYLFLHFFNYGITNYFSMGAGFETFSTLLGRPIIMLAPKLSTQIADKWRLGGGILYINSLKGDFNGLGTAYVNTTYGTEDHNLSAGMGYGFVRDSWAKRPIYTISGMTRLTKGFGLVSENWIIPLGNNYEGLISVGFRLMGERFSFDFALVRPAVWDWGTELIAVPYIDFLIHFK